MQGVKEICGYLKMNRKTVIKLMYQYSNDDQPPGRFPVTVVSGRWYSHKTALEDWLYDFSKLDTGEMPENGDEP